MGGQTQRSQSHLRVGLTNFNIAFSKESAWGWLLDLANPGNNYHTEFEIWVSDEWIAIPDGGKKRSIGIKKQRKLVVGLLTNSELSRIGGGACITAFKFSNHLTLPTTFRFWMRLKKLGLYVCKSQCLFLNPKYSADHLRKFLNSKAVVVVFNWPFWKFILRRGSNFSPALFGSEDVIRPCLQSWRYSSF